GALGVPLRIGLERVPFFLAVSERFPFQEIVKRLVRIADGGGPKTGLLNAVPLPDPQSDRIEPFQKIREAAGNTVVEAQFVEHDFPFTLPTRRPSAAGLCW